MEMGGEGKGGEEGTSGRTILTKMCMYPPNHQAHGVMEGRSRVSL